jgi:predicted nucleic acid-binding protein
VFLDSGPLGLLTNPKNSPTTTVAIAWVVTMRQAGHKFIVPAIADYEIRRELERAGKTAGLAELDSWDGQYLPLSDSALRLGAKLWAQARNAGYTTADPKELNGDVLIAAQALDLNLPRTEFIIATTNIGHLSQFVPADLWSNIAP